MPGDRLPTKLWIEGHLHDLNAKGIFYYYAQKGDPKSGLLLLKLTNTKGKFKLITQQRDFMTDEMHWVDALGKETVEESEADAYIQRAIARDPDLWAIEIEDPELNNPFE